MSGGRPAVFLDRDGVLNELVPDEHSGQPESPLQVADVVLIEGAAAAVRALRSRGYMLVCVTNQPGAAKGYVSVSTLEAVQQRVAELLGAEGASLDLWRMCLHHPDGVVAELSGPCACRKPAPGMLLDAAAELGLDLSRSWLIGDTDGDMQAARAAGCRTILIQNPASAHKRSATTASELLARDLSEAVAKLPPDPASGP